MKLLLAILAIFCCLQFGLSQEQSLPEVNCTTQPPLNNGTWQIPLDGYGMLFCERETSVNFTRNNWFLISEGNKGRQLDSHSIITVSRSDTEICLLGTNSTCDSMVATIIPEVHDDPYDLHNTNIKACTLSKMFSVICSKEWIRIRITEDRTVSSSTTTPSVRQTTGDAITSTKSPDTPSPSRVHDTLCIVQTVAPGTLASQISEIHSTSNKSEGFLIAVLVLLIFILVSNIPSCIGALRKCPNRPKKKIKEPKQRRLHIPSYGRYSSLIEEDTTFSQPSVPTGPVDPSNFNTQELERQRQNTGYMFESTDNILQVH